MEKLKKNSIEKEERAWKKDETRGARDGENMPKNF